MQENKSIGFSPRMLYKANYPAATNAEIFGRRLLAQLKIGLSILCGKLFPSKRESQFLFGGKSLQYLRADHNNSAANERCVEIPIIMEYVTQLPQDHRMLEVGAVLRHYLPSTWEVIDKYEQGQGILNHDILFFETEKPYDLIISISTLEHIGFDYGPVNREGSISAIHHLLSRCLSPGGKLVMTAPLGYNPDLDKFIYSLGPRARFMKRIDLFNNWREISFNDTNAARYGAPFNNANLIAIIELGKEDLNLVGKT